VPVPRRPVRRAFSLTELIFAVALIALLLAILLPALLGIRGAGERSSTQAAMRQMIQGFTNYASDHDGALLPGYVLDPTLIDLRVRDAAGNDISGTEDAAPYVWRLAEYLDDWRVVTTGYGASLRERLSAEVADDVVGGASAGDDALGVARIPAIGMNTVWVGGDDRHFTVDPGTAGPGNRDPWTNRYETQAARSLSEVRNTSRLVVFAPTARWNGDGWQPASSFPVTAGERIGAPALMPPRFPDADGVLQANPPAWQADADRATAVSPNPVGSWDPDGDAGVPALRTTGDELLPTARFDGSVGATTLPELQGDFRAWDPRANPVIIGDDGD